MNDSIKIWQSVVEEPDTSLLTSTVVHHAGILLKAVYQLVFREYKHGENYCNDHKTDRTTTASGAARVEHSEFPPDALEHSKIHCSANSKAPEKECQPNLESEFQEYHTKASAASFQESPGCQTACAATGAGGHQTAPRVTW